jgi:hypothetical protein
MRGLPGVAAMLLMVMVSGCSTLGPNDNPAVPGNYKKLVAASLSEKMDFSTFIKAEISEPGLWENMISPSSSRPIACARVTIEGVLGQQSYSVGYLFVNGRIDSVFNPSEVNPAAGGYFAAALKDAATCGKLTYGPFPELTVPKVQRAKK